MFTIEKGFCFYPLLLELNAAKDKGAAAAAADCQLKETTDKQTKLNLGGTLNGIEFKL